MIPTFWLRWLKLLTFGLILFGAMMFVMPGITLEIFSFIFFAQPGVFEARYSADANACFRFVHGDFGATVVGWGVTFSLILNGPFRRAEKGAWAMIALPLAAWFVTDAGYSVYTGYWRNGIFNLVLWLLFAIPLVATRRYFKDKNLHDAARRQATTLLKDALSKSKPASKSMLPISRVVSLS